MDEPTLHMALLSIYSRIWTTANICSLSEQWCFASADFFMLFSCHYKPTGKLHIRMTIETNICHLFVFSDHLQLDTLGLLLQKSLNNGQHPRHNINALQSLLWISTCYLWALVWPSQKPTQRTSSFSTLSQSVQSLSRVRHFATSWTTARQASLFITNCQSPPNLMSIESVISHPLSSPSPPSLNLSQHQGLFKWVSPSYQVAKVWEFQPQHQFFQWTPRMDLL